MEVDDALARLRSRGVAVALVTLRTPGPGTAQHRSARIVLGADGTVAGSLGAEDLDEVALVVGRAALAEGATRREHHDLGAGTVEVLAEVHLPGPAVVVLGANPVARAIAAVARAADRRVVVVAPGGDAGVEPGVEVRADDPVRALLAAPPGPADAVVISDHDAPWVDEALRILLASDAGYVGMLGSRRRAPMVLRQLRAAGVPEAHVAKLRSPVGLDIGSHSPGDIALSVVAEIVAVEHGAPGGPMTIHSDDVR